MKIKKFFKFLSYFIVFSYLLNFQSFAKEKVRIPNSITVYTEKENIYSVKYDKYVISSKRIRINNMDGVVYCLEIDEGYPSGEVFKLKGDAEKEISGIINAGFPNVSYQELNLPNENDAYFATQIAIWSYLEKYDVNKITASRSDIVNAIRKIYNEGLKNSNNINSLEKEYMSDNSSIQDVVVGFNKADVYYPKQEG